MARWLPVALLTLVACSSKKDKDSPAPAPTPGTASAAPAQAFTAQWNVIVAGDGLCSANEHGNCPPDQPCDPAAPRAIECPPGAADGLVTVGQIADGTCVVAATNQKPPCPLAKGEALPPLSW